MYTRITYRFLVLWLLLAAYVTLHEAGHAIMALLFGGEVSYFSMNLLDARVRYTGEFTALQSSVIHAAGGGLPFFVWLIFIMLVLRKTIDPLLEITKTYSLIAWGSLFAWVVVPLLYMKDKAPMSDDVTRFLNASGFNGYWVAVFVAALMGVSFIIWKKKTPEAKNIFLLRDSFNPEGRGRLIPLSVLSLLFLALMTFPWVNQGHGMGRGTDLLCQTDLSGLEGEYEMCKFWIEDEPGEVDLIIDLKNVSADHFHVMISGQDVPSITLIDYKGFSVGTSRQNHPMILDPGEYRIMMKVENAKGRLAIYLKRL